MELKNIEKQFGKKTILNSINMHIDEGIYGLLGANAVGKSTLMKIMIGALRPTRGEVVYTQNNKEEFYKGLGYLPQDFKAPKEMVVEEYLLYISYYKGMIRREAEKAIEDLSYKLNLEAYLNKKINSLSGGTLQRVGIAQAFINNPKFVILDEPSVGLDISERRNLKNFISSERSGKTVVISTHIISDIEYMVDWVMIMKSGKIINKIKYQDAIKRLEGMIWDSQIANKDMEMFKIQLKKLGGVISNINADSPLGANVRYVSTDPIGLEDISKEPELNDYYLWTIEGKENG